MKLNDWLERENLTGVEFAKRLGMSQGAVSKIARGIVWPEAETIAAIEKHTKGEVTASDILATFREQQATQTAAQTAAE